MTLGDWALVIGLLFNAFVVHLGLRGINKKQDKDHELIDGHIHQLLTEVRKAGVSQGRKDEGDERDEKDLLNKK